MARAHGPSNGRERQTLNAERVTSNAEATAPPYAFSLLSSTFGVPLEP